MQCIRDLLERGQRNRRHRVGVVTIEGSASGHDDNAGRATERGNHQVSSTRQGKWREPASHGIGVADDEHPVAARNGLDDPVVLVQLKAPLEGSESGAGGDTPLESVRQQHRASVGLDQ